MVYIVMARTVMAYTVMAHVVMAVAYSSLGPVVSFFVRGTSEGMVQALDVDAFIAAVGTIHGTIYLPSFDTSPTAS